MATQTRAGMMIGDKEHPVHVTTTRITQRAVFVVDKNNVVQLAEYVPVIGNEINFDAALAKARELV